MGVIRETHDAIVTDNEDPENRLRIKVACAALMGDEDTEVPQWVRPALAWGWVMVPDVGEQVEIEMTADSDLDEAFGQSAIDQADLVWKGVRHYSADADPPTPIHEDFQTNYGKRRGFATPNGHIFYFDDTEGKEKMQLTWQQGDEGFAYLTFDETGSVILANKNGAVIYFDVTNGANSIVDEHGNLISSDADGMKLIDKFSNIIELKDGVVQILGQGNVIINCSNCSLEANNVDIVKGANEPVVKGTTFQIYNDAHTHSTGLGPSGPPIIPLPVAALSTQAKVK